VKAAGTLSLLLFLMGKAAEMLAVENKCEEVENKSDKLENKYTKVENILIFKAFHSHLSVLPPRFIYKYCPNNHFSRQIISRPFVVIGTR
jgi:hypothetical protein